MLTSGLWLHVNPLRKSLPSSAEIRSIRTKYLIHEVQNS